MLRAIVLTVLLAAPARAIEPGTTITAERADELGDLVLPGVVDAVRRGMRIEVIEPRRITWRRAYRIATEKNEGQARIGPLGELLDYVAGLPFPNLKLDDPQLAHKVLWNYAFGPWIADYDDPYTVLNKLLEGRYVGTTNWARFDSPLYNRLLRRAASLRGAARYRAYGDLDVRLARDAAPIVAIDYANEPTLVSARVGCVRPRFDLTSVCLR